MTDMAAMTSMPRKRRLDTTSDAARALVRKRYRSEARFRAYGLIAIGVTAVFLIVLIADIIVKAIPALTNTALVLDVAVPSDLVAPDKKTDATAIRSADYFPITRDALKTAIPGIESRSAERTLTRLLSNGAADVLASKIVADPSLMGQTVKVPLLLSATADLVIKTGGTKILTHASRGTATPSGTTDEITILSSANDFAEEQLSVKKRVAEKARQLEQEAERLARFRSADLDAKIKEMRDEAQALRKRFETPTSEELLDANLPSVLVAINGGLVKVTKLSDVAVTGNVLLPLQSSAEAKPGEWKVLTYVTPESSRKATDQEIAFIERFKELGKVERSFNTRFFVAGDSREPELAGIRGAIVGSALTLFITLALCLPVGVLAAVYLEEFAPKNRITDLIEVNINNLAAVPSIVFGLLGLAMFLNFFGLPRSAPLVGGLVLALLVLPTIIIAARAALKAVPPSIKEAALGVGASHQQAVFHHILPLAVPGIMTGTIIGMAHALGETAPLLMIGMIAFVVDVPKSFTEAATVLPVQIFLWSDLPEPAFQYKTAAAILVLLGFLFLMNGAAIWLRKKFERRW